MRPFTRRRATRAAALASLGLAASLLAPATASAASAPSGFSSFWGTSRAWLSTAVDLNADDTRFDRAWMFATMKTNYSRTSSTFTLSVSGAPGERRTFGAHLHEGPCRSMDPAAAGPHYNVSTATPPVVDRTTELWLDITIDAYGRGYSTATVPFVPKSGERSIVIHAAPTDATGAAGARLVCMPVRI